MEALSFSFAFIKKVVRFKLDEKEGAGKLRVQIENCTLSPAGGGSASIINIFQVGVDQRKESS